MRGGIRCFRALVKGLIHSQALIVIGLLRSSAVMRDGMRYPGDRHGSNSEQDYFVDGVTESLTTDLSRMSGMLVIGRNTAFTYKGKAVDLKQVGRELNVRYILEGSVQRGGNRMRVNVQLVDAETGNHLWADRFDKPVADLFDMQDEIVARLANTLNTQLVSAEARRAQRAPNPNSTDLYFQGLACANKGYSPENITRARDFSERALALDPGNVVALIVYSNTETIPAIAYYSDDRRERLLAAEQTLTRALSIAPEHAFAHLQMGIVQIFTNRGAGALPNANVPWCSIEIWPSLTVLLA